MLAMNISEARQRLFELCKRVVTDNDQVIVTHKYGNTVLISMQEWESYQETVRLLHDKAALSALLHSFEAHERGELKGKTPEEVFTDLL